MLRKTSVFFLLFLIGCSAAKADLSDPTHPLTFKEAVQMHCYQGNILLQSINYGANKHVALINGSFYEVGDKVSVYKIISMTPDSVTLEQGNQKTVLTL